MLECLASEVMLAEVRPSEGLDGALMHAKGFRFRFLAVPVSWAMALARVGIAESSGGGGPKFDPTVLLVARVSHRCHGPGSVR